MHFTLPDLCNTLMNSPGGAVFLPVRADWWVWGKNCFFLGLLSCAAARPMALQARLFVFNVSQLRLDLTL